MAIATTIITLLTLAEEGLVAVSHISSLVPKLIQIGQQRSELTQTQIDEFEARRISLEGGKAWKTDAELAANPADASASAAGEASAADSATAESLEEQPPTSEL